MRIWFIATRISGNDGVSLEAVRWRNILVRMGHKVTLVAGELDRPGILIPELHFNWPKVTELHDKVVYEKNHYRKIEREVFEVAGKIEGRIREAFNGTKPDLLIVANVLSLPMHFPLAVALTRVIDELEIPTIARHHDFWWERKRFLRSSMFPFFARWFPPDSPHIKHVVINSIAQKVLKEKTGISSFVVPDTFNFESDKSKLDAYSRHFRNDFAIKKDDVIFLQATRIVPRKRIEISMDIVKKLGDRKMVLVIAGKAGDEGREYGQSLRTLAKELGIRVRFIGNFVNSHRRVRTFYDGGGRPKRKRVYTLWDVFANCDFVTYPTEVEGFGNQFIEAVFFKKPVILTPYPVYRADIEPLGFESIEISKEVKPREIDLIKSYMEDHNKAKKMVEKNFKLGKKHFSYEATEKRIKKVFQSIL